MSYATRCVHGVEQGAGLLRVERHRAGLEDLFTVAHDADATPRQRPRFTTSATDDTRGRAIGAGGDMACALLAGVPRDVRLGRTAKAKLVPGS